MASRPYSACLQYRQRRCSKCRFLEICKEFLQYSNGEQFGSIIIDGMGFSVLNTLLVRTIAYSFQGVFVVLATTLTTYIPNIHTYVITFSMLIAIAGSAMIRQIDSQNSWARLMGYCLCMAYTINFPIVLAMSSANFGGFTKRLLLTRCLSFANHHASLSSTRADNSTVVHCILHVEHNWPPAILRARSSYLQTWLLLLDGVLCHRHRSLPCPSFLSHLRESSTGSSWF